VLGESDESKQKLPVSVRWWRLVVLVVGCIVALWVGLVTAIGQGHFLVAPLGYLPRGFVGGLLLALALPGWWWGRGRMLLLGVGALVYQLGVLDYRLPPPPAVRVEKPILRVAFVNWGDHDDGAWTAWVKTMQPDVLGFTDVRGRHGLGVAQANVGHLPFLLRVGEHALASRYPFRASEVVRPRLPAAGGVQLGYLPAARFELDAPGGPVAVYVVHVRSPRDALSKYRHPKFWKWTLLGTPAGVDPNNTLDFYWKEQALTLVALLERIRQETLPTLVLGDFNLPDSGPRYRELTRTLQDAHRVAGRGYGYTFPGDLKHWAAFGQPWMRIDYLLASEHWAVLECLVQNEAADSQHRGVFAQMQR
jgi:vancomycin resistance protein VanJ